MYLFLTSFSKSPDWNTNYFCNAETLRHVRQSFAFMGLFSRGRIADVCQMTVTFESSGCIYNQLTHLLLNVFLFVEACWCVERISQERWPSSPIVLPIFYCLLLLIRNAYAIWVETSSGNSQRTKSGESVFKKKVYVGLYKPWYTLSTSPRI